MLSKLSNKMPLHKYAFEALGTHWAIETNGEISSELKQVIAMKLDQFDQTYSRFRDDSLVRKMASGHGKFEFTDDAETIISFYKELYDVSNGAVTPLVGRALEQSGYDKDYSLTVSSIDPTLSWNDAMKWEGNHVTTTAPIVLDIGAAGKGYAVDMVSEILEENNIHAYVIDASGDIRHRGAVGEQVGLEDPNDQTRVIGMMDIKNKSLCASATNRRQWGDRHHIIDPKTNDPVRDITATWVVADTTMIADGLATALFFVEPDVLSQWQFQYIRLYASGRVDYSADLKGELFT